MQPVTLHQLLDVRYGSDGDEALRRMLHQGADPNLPLGPLSETPLHVATRRRRLSAIAILLSHGADVNARTAGGKTAYVHAARRGFSEITDFLVTHGAAPALNEADRLAIAVTSGQLGEAVKILTAHPEAVHTGNPEEDRLLADVAGRNEAEPVALLIDAGADLTAAGLDDGTPLHQASWFGQPRNARLLIAAGAPVNVFEAVHGGSPLGWAAHGSRCSGGAEARQEAYVAVVGMLLGAGSALSYPGDDSDAYYELLLADASDAVALLLRQAREGAS